jgi:hypothetical protein
LAFFASHLIVQEVREVLGKDIGVNANLNMMNDNKIINAAGGSNSWDGVTLGQFKNIDRICLPAGGSIGNTCDTRSCINSWCDINDFDFCIGQDDFPPWNDDPPLCFTAKTQILMADATYKNIADIQPGEYVLTRESENSPKLVKAKVLDTYEHWDNRHFIINDFLEATFEHRMFVNGKWKAAKKIKIGDKLLNKNNQEVVVESMETVVKEEKFRVYNLKIEKYQTYFAGGFYVHNIKELPSPP